MMDMHGCSFGTAKKAEAHETLCTAAKNSVTNGHVICANLVRVSPLLLLDDRPRLQLALD